MRCMGQADPDPEPDPEGSSLPLPPSLLHFTPPILWISIPPQIPLYFFPISSPWLAGESCKQEEEEEEEEEEADSYSA